MKKLLLTTAIALLPVGAFAADLPRRAAAPAPAPVFAANPSWSGFYVGLSGGYGQGNHQTKYYHLTTRAFVGDHGADEITGGLVGGTIGYNRQMGSFVLGLEGDLSASWIKGTSSGISTDPCLRYDGTSLVPVGYCRTDINWLGTARVRAGVALGSALLYLTAGLAVGEIEAARPFPGVANNWTQTRTGWTVGGGVEYAVASNWSVKAEYLYVNLGNDWTYPCPTCTYDNHRVEVDAHLARVGVNYRFGGSPAPVVARY